MVYPKKKARIDSSLRRVIGHDIFYFSSGQAMKQFDRDPLRYVKRLSDPVTNDRFRVTRSSPKVEYRKRAYYFASIGEQATFDGDREKFRDRRSASMLEIDQ
ncbi:MAG: hypothetical protein AAB011_06825 [Candidatus Eisenbacteria bacterium]